ncbi:hypothetical protein H072_84 [Dactylellina haptotyla CBS 200.50]|uniref:Uncharacterized protein n=1 Tax=Dactylellina haptotyla (strain CBS 200.50) TaxID=1284197 RepID=S8AY54_DACHA|nr:hypothetical protein H072_84 [Dactylellina haptotyla CBS 200.50]
MRSATLIFKVVFLTLALLTLGPIQHVLSSAVPRDGGSVFTGKDGQQYFVNEKGDTAPIVPLTVSGEYFPGGPKFELSGSSINEIDEQLTKHPLYNATAFDNVTFVKDHALEKRLKQIYYCQRQPASNKYAIEPEWPQSAINLLRTPRWENAYCYAPKGKCVNVGCTDRAAVILCSWRQETVRIFCGQVAGRLAQDLVDLMLNDKNYGVIGFDINAVCVDTYKPPKFYTARTFWDADPSWEIRVGVWADHGCPARVNGA